MKSIFQLSIAIIIFDLNTMLEYKLSAIVKKQIKLIYSKQVTIMS